LETIVFTTFREAALPEHKIIQHGDVVALGEQMRREHEPM